ncbi:signal transduction histidine kinase [Neorhizobium huautlense]|uniref:Oxygen sensor histidine kinase NreB n=1 Tax=Neorhizobium huautlense TaxID=67774 RepID=A0ABT9PR95_9HYPH|nr:sensor histidine kinase [Neorhizobium huautlense]MDP9836980.1 signal transduction histidine kinase [Neorhizobium huautlense]
MDDPDGINSPIRELRRLYRDAEAKAARLRLIVDVRTMFDAGPVDASMHGALSAIAGFSGASMASIRAETDMRWQFPANGVEHGALNESTAHAFVGKGWAGGEQVELRIAGLAAALEEADRDAIQVVTDQIAGFLASERQRVLRGQLTADLKARERDLENLVKAMIGAQEQERRRIAYDLHDGVAQSLVSLLFRLEAAGVTVSDASPAKEAIESGIEIVRMSIGDVRGAIEALRPAELDDLGLEAALRARLDDIDCVQISFHADLGGSRLSDVLEVTLYRVAQEALANAVKHSGCSRIDLRLASEHPQSVSLAITDNGQGIADLSMSRERGQGVGMSAMRERMALIGGSLCVQSEPGGGTSVIARAPVSVTLKEFM